MISRTSLLLGAGLLLGACATGPFLAPGLDGAVGGEPRAVGFAFGTDTFAFPNLIRARHPGVDDLYANYCFVLARGLRQFSQFARFDPALGKLDHAGYVERVRQVGARAPWEPELAPEARVVIPGYGSLREFSGAEEAAVKEGLGPRFWTLWHWTNWRTAFFVTRAHQENVAREILEELRAGRLVQLLVTNLPKIELNHTVVAFEARAVTRGIEFAVWDPNDPESPGLIHFDREERRFWATRIYDTEPGPIRAFRMYFSPLL